MGRTEPCGSINKTILGQVILNLKVYISKTQFKLYIQILISILQIWGFRHESDVTIVVLNAISVTDVNNVKSSAPKFAYGLVIDSLAC